MFIFWDFIILIKDNRYNILTVYINILSTLSNTSVGIIKL